MSITVTSRANAAEILGAPVSKSLPMAGSLPASVTAGMSPQSTTNLSLKDRLIAKLDGYEKKLDAFVPNPLGNAYDAMCEVINGERSKELGPFDKWLLDNGHGAWYKQLATFLMKLPLRVAIKVVNQLFNLIKMVIDVPTYILMHPLKTPLKAAKLLIQLVHALVQPETWTKMGMGMMGATMGKVAVSSNPMGVLAIGIGGALALAGISVGTLKTALLAEKHMGKEVKAYLFEQAKQIPEDFLTGFGMVMMMEGIQQVLRGIYRVGQYISRENQYYLNIREGQRIMTDQQVAEFLKENGYPMCDAIDRYGTSYIIRWRLDRAAYENFLTKLSKDLPNAKFFIKAFQTDTTYETDFVWIEGYYNSNSEWVPGHLDVVTVPVPIYHEFVGYERNLVGWQDPPKPALPPALTIHRGGYQLIGTAATFDEK